MAPASPLLGGSPSNAVCPHNEDAFSFNPSHLHSWYVPQSLWKRLPIHLRAALINMQHSGAAVLTGFARLDEHNEAFHAMAVSKPVDDEVEIQHDDTPLRDSVSNLSNFVSSVRRLPPVRTASDASSRLESILGSPVFSASASTVSSVPTPDLVASESKSPISPMCLTPTTLLVDLFPKLPGSSTATATSTPNSILADSATVPTIEPSTEAVQEESHKRPRDRDRFFTTPLEPQNAYYASELSHLRTEALPRLRHSARKVDTEFYEAKRLHQISEDEAGELATWWSSKKATIRSLDDQGRRLSLAMGIPATGMGWTAP